MSLHQSDIEFANTPWSLVNALRSDSEEARRKAGDRLARTYWPAVYTFLRRKGHDQEQAEEYTQAFFSDVILNRKLFEQADASRARLRSLILRSLQNYLIDLHRRTVVRGEFFSLSSEQYAKLEADLSLQRDDDPVEQFHKRWASALLVEALKRCERQLKELAQQTHWSAFMERVINPAIHGVETPPSEILAEKYGFSSPNAFNSAVHQVRKRMLVIIKEVVAETTTGDGVAEEEYQYILGQLL